MQNRLAAAILVTASACLVGATAAQPETWRVDDSSRVIIHVGKAGAFGFAGHSHEVTAPVTGSIIVVVSDPTRSEVALEFDSASLRVSGKDEPAADVPEVQRVMVSDRVLDVKRFPKIVFRSRRVTIGRTTAGWVDASVEGTLLLHGVTKPCVVPVRVMVNGGALTAEGTATLKQSDFGIEPVAAAGGTVRTKDALDLTFTIHASR
jgi:polyisoprenoid-binding protein YceI